MNVRQMLISPVKASLIIAAVSLTAIVLLSDTTKAADLPLEVIAPGVDAFDASAVGNEYSFANSPIPAGFFDLSCPPFTGTLELEGADQIDSGDIKIERSSELTLNVSGDPAVVEIQIVELNLQSVEPIQVECGNGDQEWDVAIGMAEEPSPIGMMMVIRDRLTGGTLDANFFVRPLLTFTRVGDSAVRILDTADFGLEPVEFSLVDAPWTNSPPDNIAPSDPNFVPGSTETSPSTIVMSGLGTNLFVRPPLKLPAESAIVSIGSGSNDAFDTPNGWPGFNANADGIFAGAPGGNGPVFGGWRFENLNIPQGATITGAHVEFTQLGWGSEFITSLALEDDAAPFPFTIDSTPFDRWQNRTDSELLWGWQSRGPNSVIKTPDLASLLQEIVNRYDGANVITLLESGEVVDQGDWHAWWSVEGDPSRAAQLRVEWVVDGTFVPELIGLYEEAAIIKILEADLTPGLVEYAFSEALAGQVINQSPSANQEVGKNSLVDIVVSKGPAVTTVVNTVGLRDFDVTSFLEAHFLTVGNVELVYHDTIPIGEIISQDPVPGTQVPNGTPVNLVVSRGPAPPESIELFIDPPFIELGDTVQLSVVGNIGETFIDLTSAASGTTYEQSSEIVTVDVDGLLTALSPGLVDITALNQGLLSSVQLEVVLGIPGSLDVAPENPILLFGETQQLTVTGDFNGIPLDLTSPALGTTYVSNDPSVVSVDQDGLLLAEGLGTTEIIVGNQGVELIVPVTVELGDPDFLFVAPLPTTPLLVGESFQLTVIAQFNNGSQVDVTSSLTGTTYITSDPGVGIVSQDGLVTAQSEGEVEITIKVQSGEIKLQFDVGPGEVIGLPGG